MKFPPSTETKTNKQTKRKVTIVFVLKKKHPTIACSNEIEGSLFSKRVFGGIKKWTK